MTQSFDFLVVGAGMVGAALATGLGRLGHTVALVDQARAPDFEPASEPDIRVSALSAGSERYLQSLGAWPGIQAMRTTPYRRLAVWEGGDHPIQRLLPGSALRTCFRARDLGASHLGHIVENSVTQKALWDQAVACDRVTLFAGTGLKTLHSEESGARVELEDGTGLDCRLVIGADGAQSRTRELAGIGVTRDQYGQQALVASVRYQGQAQDITWQAFHPSGPRAFLPLHLAGARHPGECWASLVWYDSPDTLSRLKALPDEAFLEEVRQAFPGELPPLTAVAARASFPIARQHAHRYWQGRVVLAGDSAHTINPLAGQGVNLGFQDAICLQSLLDQARRQGQDPASPELLGRYEKQRRPANRRMMLAMDAFYYLFSNRVPPLYLARNAGLGMAQAVPFARNRVARYAMGIDEGLPPPLAKIIERIPGLNRPA